MNENLGLLGFKCTQTGPHFLSICVTPGISLSPGEQAWFCSFPRGMKSGGSLFLWARLVQFMETRSLEIDLLNMSTTLPDKLPNDFPTLGVLSYHLTEVPPSGPRRPQLFLQMGSSMLPAQRAYVLKAQIINR